MPELSSLLRQRMGAAGDPKTHPDADTLTAYGEELLPAEERLMVLDHISLCRQCRAVVALALPEMAQEPVQNPVVLGVRAGNWRLLAPRFALAGALIALAIVVAFVIELPKQNHNPGKRTASIFSQQQLAAATPASPAAQT
ncbi:MAG: hypothetical protein ACRD4I_10375, partial [Candidatus Angelobacter sp.]